MVGRRDLLTQDDAQAGRVFAQLFGLGDSRWADTAEFARQFVYIVVDSIRPKETPSSRGGSFRARAYQPGGSCSDSTTQPAAKGC